ncbi:acyltransferase domain-containing protein [Streptomyces flaveolus]|uniref:type I polyketide synthase n=1 Tax=Streptomyces flaveolus TaxID=67297 RepID=UPI003320371C
MTQPTDSWIAVVGMGCRFPGAADVGQFWELLRRGEDAVGPLPADRPALEEWSAGAAPPYAGTVPDLLAFDPAFFGISPREARSMDPQQRLLLHVVWEALESSGIRPSTLSGTATGVYVGQATGDYADVCGPAAGSDAGAMAGSRLRAVTSGRLSYALDLRGPSLTVDTACSSSLVAVHLARLGLLAGECDVAVAAGVNAILTDADAVAYARSGMLAADGRCKFADADADGFVRSEGAGAVLLKRLADAVRDGDEVLAVIRGSAAVNDGRGGESMLQPSVSGQAAMIRAACRSAAVSPGDLDYAEAHGTGTRVGDGIELRAWAEVLDGGEARSPLTLGSVKTNIGHTEAAAGIAGLIKTVLVARHRLIPASLHLTRPHPLLAAGDLPLRVADRPLALTPKGPHPLLSASSFGLSGTNAQVVITDLATAPSPMTAAASAGTALLPHPRTAQDTAPSPQGRGERRDAAAHGPAGPGSRACDPAAAHGPGHGTSDGPAEDPAPGRAPELLVLSARSRRSLRRLAARYARHLVDGAGRGQALRDVCFSAAVHRDAHPHRLWAVAADHAGMARVLSALAEGEESPDGGMAVSPRAGRREVAFVFPGQGGQWAGMGAELWHREPAFRETMAACDTAVAGELGWSVTDLVTADGGELPETVGLVQPALWAMEVSLAALLRARGVEPDVCLGHSMGEVAAAHAAGALTLPDAAAVICRRSALMERAAGRGGMLVVGLPEREAADAVADLPVCVAAVNSPFDTVLAGPHEALRQVSDRLEARDVFCRAVPVDVPSHSPAMEPLRAELARGLSGITPRPATTEMFSTVRRAPVAGTDLDGDYWADNLRRPVRFLESVRALGERGETVFVEVSPHPVLHQALRRTQRAADAEQAVVPVMMRRQPVEGLAARAAGRVFAFGGRVDWRRWYADGGRRVPLPSYAWDTEEFRPPVPARRAPERGGPRRRRSRDVALAALGVERVGAGVHWGDPAPLPPTFALDAAARAAGDALGRTGSGWTTLEDVRLCAPPPALAAVADAALRVALEDAPGARGPAFRVAVADGRPGARPRLDEDGAEAGAGPATDGFVTGRVSAASGPGEAVPPLDGALDGLARYCPEHLTGDAFYRRTAGLGCRVDAPLRLVERLWLGRDRAIAQLRLPHGPDAAGLEAALLTVLTVCPADGPGRFLPTGFDRVRLRSGGGGPAWVVVRRHARADGDDVRDAAEVRCALYLYGGDGEPWAAFEGIRLRRAVLAGETPHPAPSRPPASGDRPAADTADTVLRQVALVLGTTVDRLDARCSLRELGMDSLLATELATRLTRALGRRVHSRRLLAERDVSRLVEELSREVSVPSARRAPSGAEASDGIDAAEVAEMGLVDL